MAVAPGLGLGLGLEVGVITIITIKHWKQAEDFTLTLEGRNAAGRAIINSTPPGQLTIRVSIEDVQRKLIFYNNNVYITCNWMPLRLCTC